uniref:BHLH transcription factor bHLH10.5 n=1 Tax=Gardenia jasminoides TaxID=114476 RepID=A0A6M4C8Y5_GARJA|nr:bHLH transcription factor bHLH10.5 [Gardenia jasminoides]
MTHIAVERNRRKQMNDYLAVIRSMMPPSYVQRGDQASIIGGAINFVKELEQHLQTLEAQKGRSNSQQEHENGMSPPLFADFFTFPQYSTRSSSSTLHSNTINSPVTTTTTSDHQPQPSRAATDQSRSALAEIEVTMAESHANLKILSKKRPRQLLKLVAGLQCLWLTILHLNVTTTLDQRVLYSISVKLEEGCQLTTIDEIADAVNHLLGRIEEESV